MPTYPMRNERGQKYHIYTEDAALAREKCKEFKLAESVKDEIKDGKIDILSEIEESPDKSKVSEPAEIEKNEEIQVVSETPKKRTRGRRK